MKIKNILLTGIAALSLTSCNDYLEVEAPSAYTEEFVFSMKTEVSRALNGVYAQALVNDLYGNQYQRTFVLNSDVDMQISSDSKHSHNTYARYDCDEQGGEIYKFWTAAYNLIEYANKFILSAENSDLYDKNDAEYMQWIGEAKCLRAMAYHDLVVMFGDVPFTFQPASTKGTDYVLPLKDRQEIQDSLIADLKRIAPYMSSTNSVTVEHCSKEFAQALIARIALTAGGYSLRPDESNDKNYGTMKRPDNYLDYYKIAKDYADSVITAGTHSLTLSYQDVFVNECNYLVVNNDDAIFEIPFAKESTGYTGYIQGPTYSGNEGTTVGPWGATSGNGRLNAFYRFLFRDNDLRREFVNGLWYYSWFQRADGSMIDSVYIRNDYTVHNNKWSKLWTSEGSALGSITTSSTGINYPYMRYADVLLMYAEASNEINNGPSDAKAVQCLTEVHKRAFENGDAAFLTAATADKDAFQKAVMDERKWEFAGENMRWRDLVRTNTLAEELMYSFLRYYSAGVQNASSPTGYEDDINIHDGYTGTGYIDNLPTRIYYHQYSISEATANPLAIAFFKAQYYGYHIDATNNVKTKYPNQSLKSLRIFNPYKLTSMPPANSIITSYGFDAQKWDYADFYQWGDANSGQAKDQCKYSFYGFMRSDDNGNIWLVRNGSQESFSTIPAAKDLPVVRYLLPFPNLAIQRSAGAYKNHYGY